MSAGAGRGQVDHEKVIRVLERPDDDFRELVDLAAEWCEVPIAGITLFADPELVVPVTTGVPPFSTPAENSFCHFARTHHGLFLVEDAGSDAHFSRLGREGGPFGRARFYASEPLTAPDGEILGRLCVVDDRPRGLTPLQRRSLRALAASASQRLELRLLGRTIPRSAYDVDPGLPTLDLSSLDLAAPSDTSVVPESDVDGTRTAAEVVSQLAAELSHDLRVPLSSVIASVELLEDELAGHPDSAVSTLLGRAVRAADRMIRMLDQNMEGGADPARRTRVDLGEVVEQLLLDSAPLLQPAGAIVEHRDLPVVLADPDDMYSVLQNLVANSVKFARPDVPAWVRISARRAGPNWRISVRDNGVGIPDDRRVDVFSLFSRTGGEIEGHGIGLATVARIVKAHGGRAGVDPTPGSGTEVWFEVPRG
ncbi:MAG: hypothetical protein JWR42_1680 [Marmoricola sp.]|nr:hypothetical protein [Marmoricola sp.]